MSAKKKNKPKKIAPLVKKAHQPIKTTRKKVETLKHLYVNFDNLPNVIEKAELWLQPIAANAEVDSDVEAAIYFASRNKNETIDVSNLRNSWYEAICDQIELELTSAKISEDVKERLKSKTITLAEASEVLKHNNSLHRFFLFGNEEEFIDATFFRAIEWFSIRGFEPWLDALAHDMTNSLTDDVDLSTIWRLFHWCRSDLAISRTEGTVLNAALWKLMNGSVDKLKPWKRDIDIDDISIAGILPFIWHSVNPDGLDYQVIKNSLEFLFQTQMSSGGWSNTTTEPKPDIMTTCVAIHGLAMAQPDGWEQICKMASEWLMAQQTKDGFWYIGLQPTAMINVLVLDSINLANNSDVVTFKRINRLQREKVSHHKDKIKYEFFLKGEFWKITYEGKTVHLKDSKGLQYIHFLLENPVIEFYSTVLVHRIKKSLPSKSVYENMDKEQREGQLIEDGLSKGSTDYHLDEEAMDQYEERYFSLKIELEDETKPKCEEEIDEIKKEMEQIEKKLTAGKDKYGKPRKIAYNAERARKAIYKAVNKSLDKIKKEHLALWKHFDTTLTIGISSSYKPEKPIHWDL